MIEELQKFSIDEQDEGSLGESVRLSILLALLNQVLFG